MSDTSQDLRRCVLVPSREELRDTHILFHTRHATDLTNERARQFGYTVVYHSFILEHLRDLGFRVTPGSDPEMLFGDLDFDFIYFTQIERPFEGHELLIPCIAAFRGIPFLGPSAPLRGLSEDKTLAKAVAASVGVEVAPHRVIRPLDVGAKKTLPPGRWVLKPRTGVMSEHLTVIEDEAEFRAALEAAANPQHCGRDFIAEEFIPGLNLTVPVVEGFPLDGLPVFVERGEPRHNILTEAGKEGRTADYASDAYTGPGAAAAQAAAARLAAAMGPLDYARFDFRYDPSRDRLVFLEVNMNCAMGPAAVVARAAEMRGVDYRSLVGHVVTHSLRRQRMELQEPF